MTSNISAPTSSLGSYYGSSTTDLSSTPSSTDLGDPIQLSLQSLKTPATLNLGFKAQPTNISSQQFLAQLQDPQKRKQLLIQLYNAHFYDDSVYKTGKLPDFDNLADTNNLSAIQTAMNESASTGFGLQEAINQHTAMHANDVNKVGGGNTYTINLDSPESVRKYVKDNAKSLIGHGVSDQEAAGLVKLVQGIQTSRQMSTDNTIEAANQDQFNTVNTGQKQGAGLDPKSIAQAAYDAGFRGDALTNMVAVALAESSGSSTAHNTNANTGDNSYGLWQINMLGDMGPQRRKQYGLASNDDLFDPTTNARAAFALSNGGQNLQPWTTTHPPKGGGAAPYVKYLGVAQAAANSIQGGAVLGATNPPAKGKAAPNSDVRSMLPGQQTLTLNQPTGSSPDITPQSPSTYLPATFATSVNTTPQALLEEQLQKNHPVDYAASRAADVYQIFAQLFHGGTAA